MIIYIFRLIFISTIIIREITTQLYDIKFKENIPENLLISDLTTFDHQSSDSSKNKQYTLIFSQNPKINSLFSLKPNGRLHSAKLIDRESLCSQIEECCNQIDPCSILILVAVSSPTMVSPRTFECRVQIEDENDNAPIFPQNKIIIPIKESDPVGSLFSLPLATDLDTEKFSIKQYKLVEEHPFPQMFSLEQQRSSSSLNLQIIQRLDREKKSSYELTLLAIDGGSIPLTGKLLIEIKVIDVNDNPPRLMRSNYVATQKESEYLVQPLLTIEAKDDDENENAELSFKIVNDNPSQNDANKYFRVEHGTGKLYLIQPLDYEKQEKYKFYVEVFNKNGNMESATATVLIKVENLNDEKPEISINYLNLDKNNADIQENDVRTKFIALATVTDKDKGVGGQVNCKLINFEDTFEIQIKDLSRFPNQYNIQTKISLDREKIAFYKIIMECEDRGYPSLKTKKEINVNVKDLNDNAPVINMDRNLNIKENSARGSLVTKIKAVDDDAGENGEMIFSILESEEQTLNLLDIDPNSGDLRTKEIIDREKNIEPLKELIVALTVSDKGKPSLSTVITFKVKIEDENDNPPQFVNDIILFSITENEVPKYTLGEILVSDKDDEKPLKVTLSHNTDLYSSPFILFKKDNKVFLNTTRSLDWEKDKSFSLKVIASDGHGYKAHTVTAEIRVIVKDENDNAPVIIFPIQKNFTIPRLSFHEKSGFTVLTVSASDKDSSETNNGKFAFILNSKDLFMIDSSNGVIKTSRPMTLKDIGRYELNVIVRDYGTPHKESSTNLYIDVDDSKSQSINEHYKDNDDPIRNHQTNYLWTKEGFLVISLIILLLFLLICVFMIMYLRHIRGLFPVLPDIFVACRKVSKNRKCSKTGTYAKSISHIPFDTDQRSSPLNFQQTNCLLHDKVSSPFYLNQYDPSTSNTSFPLEHHIPVNLYRQYETMKYDQCPPVNLGNNVFPNSSTYNYDKLFYSPLGGRYPSSSNQNNLYHSRTQSIPNSLNNNLPVCRRIINNIETSPLVSDNVKESFNERFPSEPCLKFDDVEKLVTDQYMINCQDIRGIGKPNEKIDTYAITFPVEQSTFV